MPTEEDLLSTPAGYATPQQLNAVREYAQALLYGSGQQPVHHWTQGLSNMVSALVGGNMLYGSGLQERRSQMHDKNQEPVDPGDATAPPSGIPTGAGGSVPASIRHNNPGAQWPGPISRIFGAVGSSDLPGGNKIAAFPDPVSGAAAQFSLLAKRYAGKPLAAAISAWSGRNSAPAYTASVAKQAGLTPDTVITPELLAGPQGIALAKAMARWEAGREYPLSDQQWGDAQQKGLGKPASGPSLAFNGQPSGLTMPGAPAPMATALAGGAQVAAARPSVPVLGTPPRGSAPPGKIGSETTPEGDIDFPAGLIPHQIPVTRRQFVQAGSSPWLSPADRERITNMYYGQRQPITVAMPGMGNLIVNPSNPSERRFVPDIKNTNYKLGEGVEMPGFSTIVPGPRGPELRPVLPRSGAGTTSAPAPVSSGPPDILDMSGPPAATGSGLKFAVSGNASKAGMLGELPPEITGPATPPVKGEQMAQLPQYMQDMFRQSTDLITERKQREELAKKDADAYQKKYDLVTEVGKKAQEKMPSLRVAREIIENPKTNQGLVAEPLQWWDRLKEAVGKDPRGGAYNQIFDKLIAGNIINELKVDLQGTGQVRIAEIDLLKKAAASTNNSVPANRAVLELMIRAHELAAGQRDVANRYAKGERWDKNGKPVVDRNGRPILDPRATAAGLDEALGLYATKHPIASDKEIKEYEKLLDAKPGIGPAGTAPPSGSVPSSERDKMREELIRRGLKP